MLWSGWMGCKQATFLCHILHPLITFRQFPLSFWHPAQVFASRGWKMHQTRRPMNGTGGYHKESISWDFLACMVHRQHVWHSKFTENSLLITRIWVKPNDRCNGPLIEIFLPTYVMRNNRWHSFNAVMVWIILTALQESVECSTDWSD